MGAQQGFISIAIAAALEGKPIRLLGDPDNIRDFVHRDDVATALLNAAMEKPISGDFKIINIGSGVGTSVREIVRLIELELGRKVETVHEYHKEALGLPAYSVLNISRARDLLGWTPQIDVRAGIRRGLKEQAETIKKTTPQTAQTPAPAPHKLRA